MKVNDIKPFIFDCHEVFIFTEEGIIFQGRMSDIKINLLNRDILNIAAFNDIISILVGREQK